MFYSLESKKLNEDLHEHSRKVSDINNAHSSNDFGHNCKIYL